MRAIVFDPDAPNKFGFADVPAPVPEAPDQLLIDVRAISLNFGEVYYGDNAEQAGDVPGWDSAGVVVRTAAGGSGPPVGARVVGLGWNSGWAQQRVLTSDNVAVLPDSLDFAMAAALPVAGVSALQALRRLGAVSGRRVLVTGASGGVGRVAVQLAARAGAHVIAAVGSQSRGEGLRELGAHDVVVGLEGVAPVYGVLEHVGGTLLADAFGLLVEGGAVIAVGAASGQPTTIDFEPARMSGVRKRIEPFLTRFPVGDDLRYVVGLVAAGHLDPQVAYRDTWDNLDPAIDALLGRRVKGKVALTVG